MTITLNNLDDPKIWLIQRSQKGCNPASRGKVSSRITAQHLLWTVDTNYGDLEFYYMAEAHGNHKQREDEFSSCQFIQNSLLDCTVTAIPVNSASPHLGPKSTEGFYSLLFPISLFPIHSVLIKTSLHGDELPGSHPTAGTLEKPQYWSIFAVHE